MVTMGDGLKPITVAIVSTIIYFIGSIIGVVVGTTVAIALLDDPFVSDSIIIDALIAAVITGVGVGLVVWRSRMICIRRVKIKRAIIVSFLIIAAEVITSIFIYLVIGIIDSESMYDQVNVWNSILEDSDSIWLQLLAIGVIVPISEEIVFRCAVFGGLRYKVGFAFSAIISSIFFGLAHGIGIYAVAMFIFGIFLCLLYEVTRNILLCIGVHIVNNLLSFLPMGAINVGRSGASLENIIFAMLCAVVVIIIYILVLQKLASGENSDTLFAERGE